MRSWITLVAVTGWHRDHARTALRRAAAGPPPPKAREPVLTYDPVVIDALVRCWAVLAGPSGKRLAPALPALRAHGELTIDEPGATALLRMSAATIDRRLRPYRTGLVAPKGRSMTRPGSPLKSSIPIKTWHEWDDTHLGLLEIDLFPTIAATTTATSTTPSTPPTSRPRGPRQSPCAARANASSASDWTSCGSRFPFAVLGIHSDNGSEFINHHLLN